MIGRGNKPGLAGQPAVLLNPADLSVHCTPLITNIAYTTCSLHQQQSVDSIKWYFLNKNSTVYVNICHRHKLLYVSKHICRDRYMPKLYLKLELHIDYFTKSKHQATGEALAGWREVGQQESMMTGHYWHPSR